MDKNCLSYGIEISDVYWEGTKRQCQTIGGIDGAAYKTIRSRIG
ncbi:MAG: hypothetical protein PUP91_21275 [Rhizonema sp. PD37]|nr:hypothetical protein [Rhizonema sp. PD37]